MRILDAPPPPLDPGLFSPVDQQRYERLIESHLWKAMVAALTAEREALFAEPCPDAHALAVNRGALQWITRWLHSGPIFLIQYTKQQESSTP
jgi:hypothetical protein